MTPPPVPNSFGYFFYICEIMVPGIGFGELFAVWRKNSGLLERIGYAIGLGLSVDTLVFFICTSGLDVDGVELKGMDIGEIEFLLCLGLVGLLLAVLSRKKFAFPVRPKLVDLVLMTLLLIQGILILLYFQKYPIFPEYQSQDYGNHVQIAQGLISGSLTSIPSGILYYGVHYQLASVILLVGGEPLVTVQRAMALMVLMSTLLVYIASSKIFSSLGAGMVTAAIYCLSGTIWFVSVFNTGLYPNFFGLVAALFLIVAFMDFLENSNSKFTWCVLFLAILMVYFSHYTIITLFPVLAVVSLIEIRANPGKARTVVFPIAALLLPLLAVVLLSRSFLSHLLVVASESGGALTGSTTLSTAFASVPVLSDMALLVNSDLEFVTILVFSVFCIYKIAILKSWMMILPLLWLIAIISASPLSSAPWRFSFEALIPLTLMSGYGVFHVLPTIKKTKRTKNIIPWGQYARVLCILVLILIPVAADSWGSLTLSDSLTNTQVSGQSQQYVYSAMYWMNGNTPKNSTYLSLTDWRFTYSSLFFGQETDYQYESQPTAAVALAQQYHAEFIIVTNVVTLALPANPNLFPWNTIQNSSQLSMIYSNADVRIFKVI